MSEFHLSNKDGRWVVLLDGTDITNKITDGGVKLVCRPWPLPPAVEIKLIPERVQVELHDADLNVISRRVVAEAMGDINATDSDKGIAA